MCKVLSPKEPLLTIPINALPDHQKIYVHQMLLKHYLLKALLKNMPHQPIHPTYEVF